MLCDTQSYLDRVGDMLENWCLLSKVDPARIAPWKPVLSHIFAEQTVQLSRDCSTLCTDGAPIEACETLGSALGGVGFTIDPGPYGGKPGERITQAIAAWEQLNAALPQHDLARIVSDTLFEGRELENFLLWLGVELRPGGESRLKLYANVHWTTENDSWSRVLTILAALGCAPTSAANDVFRLLASRGFPRMLALSIKPNGECSPKIYYKLNLVDMAFLESLAAIIGIPTEPFERYVRDILRADRAWRDNRCGIGVSLDSNGDTNGLAFYHYTNPYFRDDEQLRERLLQAATNMGWDTTNYRTSSRLIASQAKPELRRLLGFSVDNHGHAGLHIYGTTGYLVPADI
jgi:hypothetical protein